MQPGRELGKIFRAQIQILRYLRPMTSRTLLLLLCLGTSLQSREAQPKPSDPFYTKYEGSLAPATTKLLLKQGDKLAICGDSITEQKMYSRVLETYLTAALPELAIACRQYGWSGEQAGGFLNRMKNDVLRFQPTIATTCYGMNDHQYVPYKEEIGEAYRKNQTAIVRMFKEAGARVVLGSSGTIHSVPGWVKSATGTWEDLNLSLLKLRNIDIEIAEAEQVAFADVFWPMLVGSHEANAKYGEGFHLEGGDGVHPGWAGQLVMASAFLKGLGVDGNLGEISIDLGSNTATATGGHEVLGFANGEVKLRSTRFPLSAPGGDVAKDDNLKAGIALIDFHQKLNRLILKVSHAPAANYKVQWGTQSKDFSAAALAQGINLAAEFETSPLTEPWQKVWNAVGAKQEYETHQIKQLFHGPEGAADMEGTVAKSEKVHADLVEKLRASYAPAEHSLTITPIP